MEEQYLTIDDLHDVCRSCLGRNNLEECSTVHYEDTPINDIFARVTAVEVSNENFHKKICTRCITKLIRAHFFIKQCLENDLLFKTLKNSSSEKVVLIHTNNGDKEYIDEYESDDDCEDNKVYIKYDINDAINKDICDTYELNDITLKPDPDEVIKVQNETNILKKITTKLLSNRKFCKQVKLEEQINVPKKKFKCDVCLKEYQFPQNLKRHKKVHTGERPYDCPICNKGFTRSSIRDEHVRCHTGEMPFICNYCGKRFSRSSSYYIHITRHKILNGEVDTNLNSLKTIRCELCKKCFSSKWSLKTHLFTHTGEKNFMCNDCGKLFITKAALESHSKIHTGIKPFACTQCKKSFAQKCGLKNHLLMHSGTKPYLCKVCSKAFGQSSHLKLHMRTHSGEKPYVCSYCGKSFALNCNLKVHTRIHTGETPYVCSICNMGFYDSSTLKKHKKANEANDKHQSVINLKVEETAELS